MKQFYSLLIFLVITIVTPIVAFIIPICCLGRAITEFIYRLIKNKEFNKNFFEDLLSDIVNEYEAYFT